MAKMQRKSTGLWTTAILGLTVWIFCEAGGVDAAQTAMSSIFHSDKDTLRDFDPQIVAALDSMLRVRDTSKFNGCFLLARKGLPVYCRCYGYANHFTKTPIDTSSVFQLASVSKPITAIAVLQLYERGLIGLHDPVYWHIPEFPYKNITIYHLLTHTSGLPDFINDEWYFCRYLPNVAFMDNEDLLKILIRFKIGLFFVPGTRHSYSNTGYAMLALLVERVTKTNFEEYLAKNVFEPAGMHRTFATRDVTPIKDLPHFVRPYKSLSGYAPGYYQKLDGIIGDKGVYSTVHDLLRLDRALRRNLLLSRETQELAYQKGRTAQKDSFAYGLGWRQMTAADGTRVVYHQGMWNSYNPSFFRYLDRDMIIVVLHNNVPEFKPLKMIRDAEAFVLNRIPSSEETAAQTWENISGGGHH
ncbi:MAG: serine hydrolase domain-containing protein [Bacteroidia bacterium]|nr:beta-lactamase family protein [Bacteroidia bacterium]MDW8333995.1 serine hydrolase domain-containing protein [Bacteroidia bacterium]